VRAEAAEARAAAAATARWGTTSWKHERSTTWRVLPGAAWWMAVAKML